MRQRVLLVEDDGSVREVVALLLERAGYDVSTCADGVEALDLARSERFDLFLLDVMLPGRDGFDVCRELRSFTAAPIVMLTARVDSGDVVKGLELGADDYVTKPFDPAVLVARARAVLRRTPDPDGDAPEDASSIEIRDLRIDEESFQAFKGTTALSLTSIEMRLLVVLVRHAGRAMTRERLLELVWGYDYLGDSRLVDMAIKRLRDKLGSTEDDGAYISTVRGVGYRFDRA